MSASAFSRSSPVKWRSLLSMRRMSTANNHYRASDATTNETMSTKNIGIREEVYEHLSAHKRDNESFSDVIERLLTEADSDWRTHFGFLDRETGKEFAAVVTADRER